MQMRGCFEVTVLRDNFDQYQRLPRQAMFDATDFAGAIDLESGHASAPGVRTRIVLRLRCDEPVLVDTYNDALHKNLILDVAEGFEEVTRRVSYARDQRRLD